MTLTKAELVQQLTDTIGLNKREAADLVDGFFSELTDALGTGEQVKLSGFGVFHLRDKPSRPGRNPKTGEPSVISARRVVSFQPSQKLRQAVELAHEPINRRPAVA